MRPQFLPRLSTGVLLTSACPPTCKHYLPRLVCRPRCMPGHFECIYLAQFARTHLVHLNPTNKSRSRPTRAPSSAMNAHQAGASMRPIRRARTCLWSRPCNPTVTSGSSSDIVPTSKDVPCPWHPCGSHVKITPSFEINRSGAAKPSAVALPAAAVGVSGEAEAVSIVL
jgi:hypothetical protein